MKRPGFAERHPLWFVALLQLAVIVVYGLAGTVAHFGGFSEQGLNALANTVLSVLAAGSLSALGWWGLVGFGRLGHASDLWHVAPLLLPVAINLAFGFEITASALLLQLLAASLLIGFAEESIFRGLMLNALKARGPWTAAIVTTVLFGLSHSLNLLSGRSGVDILIQVAYALAIGFGFAAVALRTGLIWPLVIVHALIDFTAFIGRTDVPPALNALLGLGMSFAFLSYGLYLMLHPRSSGLKVAPA